MVTLFTDSKKNALVVERVVRGGERWYWKEEGEVADRVWEGLHRELADFMIKVLILQ